MDKATNPNCKYFNRLTFRIISRTDEKIVVKQNKK